MRCVVFAYHEIGYVGLRCLLEMGAEVPLVFTHEDDPGEVVWFRSVRALAERHGLPVFAPQNANEPQWVEAVERVAPDFLFSFYYRRLLAPAVLRLPKHGALNLHGSLLPRYRGRCPVNWVLIHDEKETGVTLHYMTEKPDAGDIVAQRAVPIDDQDTALTLYRKLTHASEELLRETLPLLFAGRAPRRPQDPSQASYFGGRKPADGRIDWSAPARAVFNLVRAVTHPYPGAFTSHRGETLYVWRCSVHPDQSAAAAPPGTVLAIAPHLLVQCGSGVVRLDVVSGAGEPDCAGAVWAKARKLEIGERFG